MILINQLSVELRSFCHPSNDVQDDVDIMIRAIFGNLATSLVTLDMVADQWVLMYYDG